jgi:hypothetical protein
MPRAPVIAAALLAWLSGCGPSTATVTGKVSYKGATLGAGEIHFVAGNGESRSGLVNPDGSYEIKFAPMGEVKVAVISYIDDRPRTGPGVLEKSVPAAKALNPKSALPEKYSNAETSGLTYVIRAGTQNIDIALAD